MINNPLVISDICIHQDSEGRYSLNDLHRSSGGEQRHQPRYWLALQQSQELISEIINSEISLFNPVDKKQGRNGGTYVCRELVYSYAMWISPAFSLKVIRAYDAMMTSNATLPEQTQTNPVSQSEIDAYNINALAQHYQVMVDAWSYQIEPALRKIESPLAGRLRDRFIDVAIFLSYVKKSLNEKLGEGQKPRLF
ncbi:KilA-N domain-containing protein [Yersinia enterocolitica]